MRMKYDDTKIMNEVATRELGVDCNPLASKAYRAGWRACLNHHWHELTQRDDLLAALEGLLHGLRVPTSQADHSAEREEASRMARAAIARAKGEA